MVLEPRISEGNDYIGEWVVEGIYQGEVLLSNYPIRYCFKCKIEIHFEGFIKINYDVNWLKKLWDSKYIQFYCCNCFEYKEEMDKYKRKEELLKEMERKRNE